VQAANERWPVGRLDLDASPVSLEAAAPGALLGLSDGSYWSVRWRDDQLLLERADAPEQEEAADLVPKTVVVRGDGTIRRAWFASPTERFSHGVLGDGTEAAELRVETTDGHMLTAQAGDGAVFEDLAPRLWDVDGDADAEVWAVRSGASEGTRVEAYGVRDGELQLLIATPPKDARQWLNPIGLADFSGDGWLELALIADPEDRGFLTLYRVSGDALVQQLTVPGFSNHAPGSHQLGMSWVGDIDGDSAADVLVPGKSRRELAAFSFAGGRPKVLGASEVVGHILTNLVALKDNDGGQVIVFADDGPALRWLRLPD
jgi:hypothetical protein